jgi:hypothetical protein
MKEENKKPPLGPHALLFILVLVGFVLVIRPIEYTVSSFFYKPSLGPLMNSGMGSR